MSVLDRKKILTLTLALSVFATPLMAGWFSDTKDVVGSWFNFSSNEVTGSTETLAKTFTHQKHTAEGIDCSECHIANTEGNMNKPGLEECSTCHDGDGILTENQLAGKFTWTSKSHLSKELIFSHDTHVSAEVQCLNCHQNIDQNTNIKENSWLRMKDCTSCHASEVSSEAASDCSVCHTKINKEDKPDFHGATFMRSHGALSQMSDLETRADCSLCHKENQCTSCHSSEMPKSHNSHFVHRGHGIAASINRESCATCHRTDTCESCHATTAPTNHTPAFGGSKSRHCGTCHFPQEQTECYTCHKSAPSHFSATSMPGNTAHQIATENSCRECHVPGKIKHIDNGQSCKECHK